MIPLLERAFAAAEPTRLSADALSMFTLDAVSFAIQSGCCLSRSRLLCPRGAWSG